MIRMTCPGCQSTLNAKEELAGQTRKCPKCGKPLLIPQAPAPDIPQPPPSQSPTSGPPERSEVVEGAAVAKFTPPRRLDSHSRYLICDNAKLIAAWDGGGQGWMLKTNTGLISATRNRDQIPVQGDFKLIELKMAVDEAGLHLIGLTSFQLAQRWALVNLARGDDKVLSAIVGLGRLNRDQKNVVRQVIKDQLMYDVWKDAEHVLGFLANTDYHSPGT